MKTLQSLFAIVCVCALMAMVVTAKNFTAQMDVTIVEKAAQAGTESPVCLADQTFSAAERYYKEINTKDIVFSPQEQNVPGLKAIAQTNISPPTMLTEKNFDQNPKNNNIVRTYVGRSSKNDNSLRTFVFVVLRC